MGLLGPGDSVSGRENGCSDPGGIQEGYGTATTWATSVHQATVDKRLKDLQDLLALVDPHITSISAARLGQDSMVWSEIPSCQSFAATYTQTLEEFEMTLRSIRNGLGEAFDNIRQGAAKLNDVDRETQQTYARLAAQFNAAPPPTTIVSDASAAAMAAMMEPKRLPWENASEGPGEYVRAPDYPVPASGAKTTPIAVDGEKGAA